MKLSLRPSESSAVNHFNHQPNVVSTGKIDVKGENMTDNIT